MLIHKAFRFRVYPTAVQRERLARWENALRWLWNLANEQRQLGLTRCHDDKVYVHYAAQNRELTELRRQCPWLNDVPSDLCQAVLRDLDAAWRLFFSRRSRIPRYKSRSKDHRPALRCEAPKRFRFDDDGLDQFPKLGRIKTILHRAINGVPKTCALVREGNQWFVSVTCQVDVAEPSPRLSPSVGIARVTGGLYATSTGQIIPNPPEIGRTLAQLKRAWRTVERRQKGSRRNERAKQRVIRLQYTARRQQAHALHVESKRLAESQGNVVVETSWSAAHRSGRGVSNSEWYTFVSLLKYKLAWSGGTLVEVCHPRPPDRCGAGAGRTGLDESRGVAAAVQVLRAWESLVPARGRQPVDRPPVEA